MQPVLLEIQRLSVNLGGRRLLTDISFSISKNQHWAIVGDSGSGKTLLGETIAGRHFHQGTISIKAPPGKEGVVFVAQSHHFRDKSNTSTFYYQQRYNSYDAETTVTVREYIESAHVFNGRIPTGIAEMLHLDKLADEHLIQLSNGENKRLQLALALLSQPAFLILDQPFAGLDEGARALLTGSLKNICSTGTQLIIICTPREIPGCITHVITLDEGRMTGRYTINNYRRLVNQDIPDPLPDSQMNIRGWLTGGGPANDFHAAVSMKNVSLKYGNKFILQNINWTVKKGERWCIQGPNGAGKSSLLSLITGDNPQAYANEIYLFDKRRGTGESIWDIKRRIGFLSPELLLFFDGAQTVFDVIASGFFDTIGLFRALDEAQENAVRQWMAWLDLEEQSGVSFQQIPASQQRFVFLARALVKQPPVLILDEPTQGLDSRQRERLKSLINLICARTQLTLIYISHYKEDIPSCIDHFLFLEEGKVKPQ